jgi:alpha-D-ribose 1-methylphosphonate 5-triphosphate synthase subunit PhnH
MVEHAFQSLVFDAQRVFRTVLTALSEPGRILSIEAGCVPPDPLDPVAAAIVLTLCDSDTPLWLAPNLAAAASFIRFHTGAPIVTKPAEAMFAVAGAAQRPPLAALNPGTAQYPDGAATLVLTVEALDGGAGWSLSGPGISGSRSLLPRGIDDDFAGEWRSQRADFPLGIDVLFAARSQVAGLPRSTTLKD